MELNNLKPAKGSTHHDKRIGRGAGSGHGGTATRGHKGAQSRSGYSRKLGFEGGQMPLQRRLPKFGFTNLKRVEFKAINLSTLGGAGSQEIAHGGYGRHAHRRRFHLVERQGEDPGQRHDFEGARRQGACVLEERRGGHHGSRGQRRKTVSNLRTQKL